MSIVFGTDFSELAQEATRAVGALARRMGAELHLAHVTEYGSAARSQAGDEALRQEARRRLEAQGAALEAEGTVVRTHLLEGAPDEVLVDLAEREKASLLVVTHQGQRAARWRLGNVPERVAQAARCPVLVLRSPAPVEAWARGQRSLRVLLGLDFSRPAEAAEPMTAAKAGTSFTFCQLAMPAVKTSVSASMLPLRRFATISS